MIPSDWFKKQGFLPFPVHGKEPAVPKGTSWQGWRGDVGRDYGVPLSDRLGVLDTDDPDDEAWVLGQIASGAIPDTPFIVKTSRYFHRYCPSPGRCRSSSAATDTRLSSATSVSMSSAPARGIRPASSTPQPSGAGAGKTFRSFQRTSASTTGRSAYALRRPAWATCSPTRCAKHPALPHQTSLLESRRNGRAQRMVTSRNGVADLTSQGSVKVVASPPGFEPGFWP